MKALIIYHVHCMDGFTAAWIAEAAISQAMDTNLVPAQYGDEPPYDQMDSDTQCYIVDFSYGPKDLKEIAESCNSVTVLDHHKATFERLAGFNHPKVRLILDANRSGAGICWTFFNGTQPMPDLVAVVQDYDLWRFKYNNTAAVNEAMWQRDFELEAWDTMAAMDLEELETEGKYLLAAKLRDISAWAKKPVWQTIGGIRMPCLNLPSKFKNEACLALIEATGSQMAATYHDIQIDGVLHRVYSLRSNGFDVDAIAKLYGGGGHRTASGFKILGTAITVEGPSIEEPAGDIEWESPLEEAQALLRDAMNLIDKAMEEGEPE